MTAKLQTLIESARQLTPFEQVELIRAVSQLLAQHYQPVPVALDFWQPRTLEQIVQDQPSPIIQDIITLQADFWPKEETADDFIDYIYQQRTEDRTKEM